MTNSFNGDFRPFIVGLGGTTKAGSSTEKAVRIALQAAEEAGARTKMFDGSFLARLPHYIPENQSRTAEEQDFVSAVRKADGVIVGSPGYHGGISGLVKNALDLLEDTASDDRVYLEGLPVGLIVTAYGWQATGSTLAQLRGIVHALRGWPTPLGATIKSSGGVFSPDGRCTDQQAATQLAMVGRQVVEFATWRAAAQATQTWSDRPFALAEAMSTQPHTEERLK